jgi:hypothetical protein
MVVVMIMAVIVVMVVIVVMIIGVEESGSIRECDRDRRHCGRALRHGNLAALGAMQLA